MKPRTLPLVLAAMLLAALACGLPSALLRSPTPTPEEAHPGAVETSSPPPAETGAGCLVGTWELADMSEFMKSVVPSQNGTLTYQGTTGSARYIFAPDGRVRLEANDLKVSYRLEGDINLDFQVSLNGTASGDYSVSTEGILSTTNVDFGALTLSVTMAGVPAVDSTSLQKLIPFFGEGTSTVPFTCTSTTLTYTPAAEGAKPIVFTRVAP